MRAEVLENEDKQSRDYQGRKLCSEMQLHISCYVHYRDRDIDHGGSVKN